MSTICLIEGTIEPLYEILLTLSCTNVKKIDKHVFKLGVNEVKQFDFKRDS